jgi:hypothetical protein
MKRLAVFILLLSSSFISRLTACGFYPYGESVRFCYFKPRYFNYDEGYNYFNYTSDWYDYSSYDANESEEFDYGFYAGINYHDPNLELWAKYCNNKVNRNAIDQAIYKLPATEINRASNNAFLRYLYASKDLDAINYILFAKQCEQYTWNNEDPWEKNENKDLKAPGELTKEAGLRADKIKNGQLKNRYLFLKVRLAFYHSGANEIRQVYDKYFKDAKEKDLLYYWVLFYYTQTVADKATENYYAAQVFAHAADRRFVVRSNYDRSIPIEETLKHAKTPEEVANIWLLHGIWIEEKGLPYIINVYKNNPASHGLGFLLLREINKMEDWILTPQYSLFEPSTRGDYWENNNARRILQRVKLDRAYAREVLNFINTVDFSKTDNPAQWQLSQCYLAFLAQDNVKAVAALRLAEKQINKSNTLYAPLQVVKGLVLVAAQEQGKAGIPDEVRPILMEQYKDKKHKYLFGIGRELEEKGNTTLAALLFAKASDEAEAYWDYETVNWKAKNNVQSMYSDYYWEYLTYMDACYTIPQMHDIIDDVTAFKAKSTFDNWLYGNIIKEKHELYRILGTKYFREGKLAEAAETFKNIKPADDFYFDENPFYKIKFTPEFTADYNKKHKVNRSYITANLITVLAKANNTVEKDRDYYYFLAGNCYYNISFYGNAWNMSHRFMSASQTSTGLPDDDNYFGCKIAMHYYTLAYKHAKTPKFKALCLRMMAECRDAAISQQYDSNWRYNYRYELVKEPNAYDAQFKKQYGAYYNDLYKSNCTAFEDYFKARR